MTENQKPSLYRRFINRYGILIFLLLAQLLVTGELSFEWTSASIAGWFGLWMLSHYIRGIYKRHTD